VSPVSVLSLPIYAVTCPSCCFWIWH